MWHILLCRYGWLVLAVECIGATTIVLYGVNLLFNPVAVVYEEDVNNPGKPITKRPYHVRACVPCYKESLEILRRTVMALYDAQLPEVHTSAALQPSHALFHAVFSLLVSPHIFCCTACSTCATRACMCIVAT